MAVLCNSLNIYCTLNRIIVSLKSHFLVSYTGECNSTPNYFCTSVKLSEKEDHPDSIQTLHMSLHSENVLLAQYLAVQSEDAHPTHLDSKKHWKDIEYLFYFL